MSPADKQTIIWHIFTVSAKSILEAQDLEATEEEVAVYMEQLRTNVIEMFA